MAEFMYLKRKNTQNSLINISQFPVSDTRAVKEALTVLNGRSVDYGLVLTVKQINVLCDSLKKALIESDRIELGSGVLPILAEELCSSALITQENYASVLEEMIHIFFKVKTAVCDKVSDRDLVRILKDFFENKSFGSIELMRDRDIDIIARYIETENLQMEASEIDVYESDGYIDERT